MTKNIIRNVVMPFSVIIVVLTPMLFFDKGNIVLAINKIHTPFLDELFKMFSAVGNGSTIAIWAIIVLLFFRLRFFIQFFFAFVFQLSFVLLFKKVIFRLLDRPYVFFNRNEDGMLHLVEGVKIIRWNSFPSGHTTTVFFIATFFALMINNKWVSMILFVFAFMVGLSRIYLVQHFFIDVFFGIIFGFVSSLVAYYIVSGKFYPWYDKRIIDFSIKK